MGRTGRLFAHEWAGVPPDIMAVAKALGNGFPIGACLATEKAAAGMVPGTHGSTFGGNPMAVACGNAVLDVMLEPGFFERVERIGAAAARPARKACRGLPAAVRRIARLRAAARHPLQCDGRRFRREIARRGAAVPDGRRQCVAHPAAADRRRARNRRGRSASSTRSRGNGPQREPDQSGVASRAPEAMSLGERPGAWPAAPFPRYRPARDGRAAPYARSRLCLQERPARPAARRQDAGDDFREALDAYPGQFRGRDAPARRRCDHARYCQQPARARRDDRRHGARAVALCRCDHDPHATMPKSSTNWRGTPPCR